MILNALEGRPLPIYGDGRQIRDWLYVEDHCQAIRTVLSRGRARRGLQHRRRLPTRQSRRRASNLRDGRSAAAGTAPRTLCLADHVCQGPPGHDRRYAIDAGKIQSELGWTPREDFESGLERTVRWYLDHSTWIERITSGKYQRERLGLGSAAKT